MRKQSPTFWRCNYCGNLAEKLIDSGVKMVCCGEAMAELTPNTVEASAEKHLPVAKQVNDYTTKIEVGSAPHPMTAEHHIAFIYVETEEGGEYAMLDATAAPEADFHLCLRKPIAAYAYCNLHGLWKTPLR